VPGSSIEADRQWALARAGMILRKEAAAGAKPAASEEEAQVSEPGEPAEKEADQVADGVAEKLHGGGAGKGGAAAGASAEEKEGEGAGQKEGGTEGQVAEGEAGQEKAPEIGAKLQPGVVFRAADPTKKKAKAITDIQAKAATFGNMRCVECADALKAILVKAGVKGSVVTLTNKPKNKNGFVYCISKKTNVSNSNFHVGVEVDGVVYDNHHPSGVARGAWVADFAHMNKPDGGAGAFDISEAGF
jgi:hypothetical protein